MAAGAQGDHPLNDVLLYGLSVYNKKCDSLIREISKLMDSDSMFELLDWFDENRNIKEFEKELNAILNKLKKTAKSKGWDLKE